MKFIKFKLIIFFFCMIISTMTLFNNIKVSKSYYSKFRSVTKSKSKLKSMLSSTNGFIRVNKNSSHNSKDQNSKSKYLNPFLQSQYSSREMDRFLNSKGRINIKKLLKSMDLLSQVNLLKEARIIETEYRKRSFSNLDDSKFFISEVFILENNIENGIPYHNKSDGKDYVYLHCSVVIEIYANPETNIDNNDIKSNNQKRNKYMFFFERMVTYGAPDIRFQYVGRRSWNDLEKQTELLLKAQTLTLNHNLEYYDDIIFKESKKSKQISLIVDEKPERKKRLGGSREQKEEFKEEAKEFIKEELINVVQEIGMKFVGHAALTVITGGLHIIPAALVTSYEIGKKLYTNAGKITKAASLVIKGFNAYLNPFGKGENETENDEDFDLYSSLKNYSNTISSSMDSSGSYDKNYFNSSTFKSRSASRTLDYIQEKRNSFVSELKSTFKEMAVKAYYSVKGFFGLKKKRRRNLYEGELEIDIQKVDIENKNKINADEIPKEVVKEAKSNEKVLKSYILKVYSHPIQKIKDSFVPVNNNLLELIKLIRLIECPGSENDDDNSLLLNYRTGTEEFYYKKTNLMTNSSRDFVDSIIYKLKIEKYTYNQFIINQETINNEDEKEKNSE